MIGMISVLPETDDKSVQGAFAILGVVGDNNQYKKRLTELTDLVKKANDAQAASEKARAEADKLAANAKSNLADALKVRTEGVTAKAEAEGIRSANELNIRKREADLAAAKKQLIDDTAKSKADIQGFANKRKTELDAREEAIATARAANDAAIMTRSKGQDEREKALSTREVAVRADGQKNKELAAQLVQRQSQLETKFAKLRDIVG